MSSFITGEIWCLLTNDLTPLYVINASLFSALVWAMELGFWTACQSKSNDAVPDLCPVIFKNGKDSLFALDPTLAPAQAAVYLAGVLIVLYVHYSYSFTHAPFPDVPTRCTNPQLTSYLIYTALGMFVFFRERSRAKQRKWIGTQKRASLLKRKSSDEEDAAAAAAKMQEIEKEAKPMLESRVSLAQENRRKTVTWE